MSQVTMFCNGSVQAPERKQKKYRQNVEKTGYLEQGKIARKQYRLRVG